MKGYFVLFGQSAKTDNSGVGQKIRNQIKAFNNAGLNCQELVFPISKSKLLSILYRLPFFNVLPVWSYKNEFKDADYIYMRRPFVMNGPMRKLFRRIREYNPSIKIVIEIPTFPYDMEYNEYKLKELLLLKDKYNRHRLKNLVDYFAILTDEKEIFGIPTIKISNGIELSDIHKRVPLSEDKQTIHICAVAMFKNWHGYERFIEGLKDYYTTGGERNIICHFAGIGTELANYKQLVSCYSLEKHFVFHGLLKNGELDKLYNLCTVSLGSFGMYKIGLNLACNLKSREAVARGIPMVTGCPTDIFSKSDFEYYLEFPNDETKLDIQKIIDFHDKIYKQPDIKVIDAIRDYAYEKVSIDKCMENVIDYFKS